MRHRTESSGKRWHQSIQAQLGFSLLAIITGILTLFGIYQYHATRVSSLQELHELAATLQARLAEYLIFPLWNMNFELIERTIVSEMQEKRIYAILVREVTNNTLLNGKMRDENWRVIESAGEIAGETLLVRQEIVNNGEKLGSVEIYLASKFMNAKLRREVEQMIVAIVMLDAALLFFLSVTVRRLVIRPLTEIVQIATAIAAGDFHHAITLRRRNEIGDLAAAFQHMKARINDVLVEQDAVNQAIQAGKLASRGNAEAFTGKWRDLIVGVNNVITAFVTPINTTAAYLDQLSKGDLPPQLTAAYQGDFANIKNNLNMLIEATYQTTQIAEEISNGNLSVTVLERSASDELMQALNRMVRRLQAILYEMDRVVKTVQDGKLEARGQAANFAGGWRAVIVGLNTVIDTFMEMTTLSERLKDENLRMNTEMELARRIQTSLLPTLVTHIHPDFTIAAVMLPAAEVGGDYYDITFDRDGKLWFGIGDVSGHGVTPGLIMMMAQTIHTTITSNYPSSPRDVVIGLNKVLYKNIHDRLKADHFMTFTTLKYLENGRFQHAGMHLDLIVYRQQSQTCELIDTDGAYLNFVEDITQATENAEFTLNVGDLLLLYTDGLTEACNAQQDMFDTPRLIASVAAHAAAEPEALRDAIIQDVLTWCDNQREDDMSLVVVRRVR